MSSFLSDDWLWRTDSPSQEQEIFEEDELTELQIEVAENRILHAKINKVLPKLNSILDFAISLDHTFYAKKINEIINNLK